MIRANNFNKPCDTIRDIGNSDIDFGDIKTIVGLVIKENHLVQRNASVLRNLLELATLVCLVDVEIRMEDVFQMISFSNGKLSRTNLNLRSK